MTASSKPTSDHPAFFDQLVATVEQVAVDEEHGAPRLRLHQQGQTIGRGTHLLSVRFRDDTIALRPDLVRVLTTDGG